MSKKRPWWSYLILDWPGFQDDRRKARDRRTLRRATALRRKSARGRTTFQKRLRKR